jgi:branched-chain amino acid transport system substrate-binding protein
MAGDALADREFASIAGPASEGVLFTFGPDPRKRPAAAAVVKKFRDKGTDPEGYVLYTYAAFQVWAQAAAKAGTSDPQKVAAAMRTGTWDTVLGPLSFDEKGDITSIGWAVFRWGKDGNYDQIADSGPS